MVRHAVCRLAMPLAVFCAAAIAGVPAESAPENPRLTSVTVSPNRVDAGSAPVTGTVILDHAPASNVSVSLHSTNTQAATVPSTVVVAKGQTQGTFSVNIGKPSATATVGIAAMYGGSSRAANLVVQVASAPKVQSVTPSPKTVSAGGTVLVVVKLNALAPSGGQVVNLAYTPGSMITGPTTVTVPERAVATEVQVKAGSPAKQTVVTINATINKVGVSSTVTVKGTAPITPTKASISPGRLQSNETGTLTVQLSDPAPSGGLVVALSCSNKQVLSIPSSVTVPAGATSARTSVTAKTVVKSATLKITATASGGSATASVDVVAPQR